MENKGLRRHNLLKPGMLEKYYTFAQPVEKIEAAAIDSGFLDREKKGK